MAPKKPPQNDGSGKLGAEVAANRSDAERIRQAADEALWVESAEELLEEVDKLYSMDDEDEASEDEEAEAAGGADDSSVQKVIPDTREMMILKQLAEVHEEMEKNKDAYPVLFPELKPEIPQEGALEWKCVYGKKGAKYEGTLNVYRTQQMFGLNQPQGPTEDDEEADIRVQNKESSTLVYQIVYREYITGRGVHQALHGDQYAGEWWGGLRQGHGTQTWINRERIRTVDDVDFYRTDNANKKTSKVAADIRKKTTKRQRRHPFFTGRTAFAYLHDKQEEPGWIRPEDGELRGKHGAFPDVYQWTTADNLVGTYTGQWYKDTPEGCGVMVWSDGTSLAGEWRRGAFVGNFPVCTHQESDFHMRLGQLAAQKAKMFQYKPQDMTVIHEKPHLWQHPYFYDDGDQWRAPGPINQFYEVPPEYRARVERMDAEREAWLDGWKNAGKDHPDWQQQWTAIEAVEQQKLVQVNFGEASPLMELAEQASKTDNDNVHEQLRLSAAARGAIIPSMRELRELATGRQIGPGQLLTQMAQGKAPPLQMEDIEATIQFVDKYGEEGLIGVDDVSSDGSSRPLTVERARELLLDAIPETLLRESQLNRGAPKSLEPPPVNLLRLETQPMRDVPDKDSPEYAQKVKERVLRRAEEALQELNDQLQVALRLRRLPGLPLELDEAQRDYLRKVKDEYQLRLNAIRDRRRRALAVDEVSANEANMGGIQLSDVERKARLEALQRGDERALLPDDEEAVGDVEPRGWQERDDRTLIQALATREEQEEDPLLLPGLQAGELKKTQKHAQRFYNLELDVTEKLLEFGRALENYSRVPDDLPLEKPSPNRPQLLPPHPPGQVLNPLPPVNTPAEASEAILSTAHKAGYGPLQGFDKFLCSLRWRNKPIAASPTAPIEAYADYLKELPVRSRLDWTADAASRVAVGPDGEVIEAVENYEYQDSLERLRAEQAELSEEIRREQDALLAEEASTYAASALDLARREAAELMATKLDSRFWGDQTEEDKNRPIHEWEPKQFGKSEEKRIEESRSIRDEINRRIQAARDAEEEREFDATCSREENQERLELQEVLERKTAALAATHSEEAVEKLLAESTFSQPGTLVEVELAIEEGNVGDAMPIPAAPGAEDYSERVVATLRDLRDIELDRARDAAELTKKRLTLEEGEDDLHEDEAALVAEAHAQIEAGAGDAGLPRLERLEKKIMDLKWERFLEEEKEANKAFELLGATYEPELMAKRRLISGLRNRQLELDSRLEDALADFFTRYEAEYGPSESERSRIFDKWLAKWVAAEERLSAEPLEQLEARAEQERPVAADKTLLQKDDCPPVLKDFLAKLADLEQQRDAEARQEQQKWQEEHSPAQPWDHPHRPLSVEQLLTEMDDAHPALKNFFTMTADLEAGRTVQKPQERRFPALPAPKPATSAQPRQEAPVLDIHDGLDAVEIAQKRARELLTELQTERVEAEVTRQLRAEIAASGGGWDLKKASKALRKLGSERRKKRVAEWEAVLEDAFRHGNLDRYPLLLQLERSAQEQLGLQGELPRGHILWAPLLRPAAPFSAARLAGNPRLPLPFRIGKEDALTWKAAAEAYSGVYRPTASAGTGSEVQVTGSGAVVEKVGNTQWEAAKASGGKWLKELQTSILDVEAPGWRDAAAQAGSSAGPFPRLGTEAGLAVLAEHPLFDLQVKPADFRERVAARLALSQMTGRVFDMLDMTLAPGSDQLEYVYAPKTFVPADPSDEESSIWNDPERPEWSPSLSIFQDSEAVQLMVASEVKRVAKDTPAPSELAPLGSSLNFDAAVEQRKKQVLRSLLKKHKPAKLEKVQPEEGEAAPQTWRPGENEFTASEAEVNRFIESVREPKDLETTIASLRRVVAAQDEFEHIVERGQSLMTSAEQRFAKDFLVPKTRELRALENRLWKKGMVLASEQPELVAMWNAEWDAREALLNGVNAVLDQPANKALVAGHDRVEKELQELYKDCDKLLSEADVRRAKDRANAAERLTDDEYAVPELDYNGRPVLTGAPEEVGANAEEEWELAYEEMEQRDMNTALYNERDERDGKFFEDGLSKARDAIRKLGGTAVFSEDLANFTRTLFKDDMQLARELLGPDLGADSSKDEYEEVEVEVDDDEDDEESFPDEEDDFWEALRARLQATSPAELEKKAAEEKPPELTLKDVLPDEQESRIVAQVEAERPTSTEKAVLWNMTEDDETKIDIFTVAPDGKFSKFDEEQRDFLPYVDLDALVVNPAAVKLRPGSKEEQALRDAEKEAAWQKEQERMERGMQEEIPADALEIDEYGYAVVKEGVQEEEQEDKTTGTEWRRQPWYSDEQFFDFLDIPKAAPELTLDQEKEFLLEGKVWRAANNTPWIGDEGEITDPETKKKRVDAAVAAHEAKMKRLRFQANYNRGTDKHIDALLVDDVDELEKEMMRSVVLEIKDKGTMLLSRNAEGTLVVKPKPPPETEEERMDRLKREAAEELRKLQNRDDDVDDEWRQMLRQQDDGEIKEMPADGWWGPEARGERVLGEDEDVDCSAEEEGLGEDEEEAPAVTAIEGENEWIDDNGDDDEEMDEQDKADLRDLVEKINAGEFVPPRLPRFIRRAIWGAPKPPPPPTTPAPPTPSGPEPGPDQLASVTMGALQVLPGYTDAMRWMSSLTEGIRQTPLRPAKKIPRYSTAKKRSKAAAKEKRARFVDRGFFSLAVPLNAWATRKAI